MNTLTVSTSEHPNSTPTTETIELIVDWVDCMSSHRVAMASQTVEAAVNVIDSEELIGGEIVDRFASMIEEIVAEFRSGQVYWDSGYAGDEVLFFGDWVQVWDGGLLAQLSWLELADLPTVAVNFIKDSDGCRVPEYPGIANQFVCAELQLRVAVKSGAASSVVAANRRAAWTLTASGSLKPDDDQKQHEARWEQVDILCFWQRERVCRCHMSATEPVCPVHDLSFTGFRYTDRYEAYVRLARANGWLDEGLIKACAEDYASR